MNTTTYKATFANGTTIIRNNHTGRVYTHGWIARHTMICKGETLNQHRSGFAISAKAAERAARSQFPPKYFKTPATIEVVPVVVE